MRLSGSLNASHRKGDLKTTTKGFFIVFQTGNSLHNRFLPLLKNCMSIITEFILRGEENCKRSVQFGFHHRTERTMEDFKRDILLKVIGFDVLTEFVLNDIINMCSELEKRLHHRDPVDRTVFDIYNGIKLLAGSRIEEKIFETEIESQTSYESKRDLLHQALARPSSTTFLQKFIQNKSTEMCKSIESELSEPKNQDSRVCWETLCLFKCHCPNSLICHR